MRARAVVGPALVLVGVVHVGLTPVLHPEAVRRMLDAGVLAAVEADPTDVGPRSLAFWYATTGVSLVATGVVVTSLERRLAPLPPSLPWVLLGVGAWGIVQLPASPFWVFPVLAAVTEVRRRRFRASAGAEVARVS